MTSAMSFATSPYCAFMQHSSIELANGQRLHVEIGGNPEHPSILLIMGLGGQVLHWPNDFCLQLIEAGFQVIRYDHRDVGLSSKHTDQPTKSLHTYKLMARYCLGLASSGTAYTLYDLAEDASLLIQALGLKAVHVIGASMGGMIAQILAAKYAAQVLSVGLLFTSNNQRFLPPPFPKQLLALMSEPSAHDERTVVQHSLKIYQAIGSPGHFNLENAQNIAQSLYRRNYYPEGSLRHFLAIFSTGSLQYLDKQIQQPTIVIHGSRDRLIPAAHGRAVAKAIKNVKFELIEGLGHDLPPFFNATIVQIFVQHFHNSLF